MTLSEMFKTAHRYAAEDARFDQSRPYSHYFRLHLLQLHAEAKERSTGLARAFQSMAPWYQQRQYNPRTSQWVTL